MPRKVAYALITKHGATFEDQIKAIKKAIWPKMNDSDVVYSDKMATRTELEKRLYRGRDLMLRQLRPGDEVCIASPGRLGMNKDEVLSVVQAIRAKACVVVDASSGLTIDWTPEVVNATSFMDRAVQEHKLHALEAARATKLAKGIKGGAPIKEFKMSTAEVERLWFNQADYGSAKIVADLAGTSERLLYQRFGPRGGISKGEKK